MTRQFNFIDPLTKEEFFISSHATYIGSGGERVHKDKSTGKQIVNPTTGTILEYVPMDTSEGFTTGIQTWHSMSKEDKKLALKKRSRLDAKKNQEYKRYLDTNHIKGQE